MSDNLEQTQTSADSATEIAEGGENATAVETAKKPVYEEKTISLEELKDESEYSEDEFNEMMGFYEKTLTDFVEGELVVGKILAVNDKEVAVDIGFKSEGVIPIDEFYKPEDINIGDDIEVFLDNVEDNDGQLVLSKRKADFLRIWEKIIDAHDKEEILQGICTRRIKGGIVVDLMGVDAFLPGSQIDVKPIRDFDALIGQEMDFKIVKVNEMRKNIVVSHRALIEEGMKEQRAHILENLDKGQILEGSVKNITDFGVFIDLGGVDGLLHINDLSWGRVSHPSEIVSLDEKIQVQILDFNDEKNRISLGLKQLQPHPWDNVKDKYKEGDVVSGKVVNISDYGSFIELEKGIEGLIHISEMSWTQHIKHPSRILSLGEIVEAKILNLDFDGRKISLGLKQLEPDPWDGIEAKYPVDSKQKGIVRNLTNFGAFVELEEGVDGLVHISDLSWTKKIRHPGEVLKKGDEVEIVVLNIEQGNRRISLGYKQTMDNPWDSFQDTYKPGTLTSGEIVRMIEKGVIVELPDSVDGFVPLSQLKKDGLKKPADGYNVGDKIELAVIELNKENKKIILSEKQVGTEVSGKLEKDDQDAIAEFEKEVASVEGFKAKDKPKEKLKGKPKAEQPKAEQPKAEQPKAEQPKAEEAKAEEPKAEEPKAEVAKAEVTEAEVAEEPKTEEASAKKETDAPAKKATKAAKAKTEAEPEVEGEATSEPEPEKETEIKADSEEKPEADAEEKSEAKSDSDETAADTEEEKAKK